MGRGGRGSAALPLSPSRRHLRGRGRAPRPPRGRALSTGPCPCLRPGWRPGVAAGGSARPRHRLRAPRSSAPGSRPTAGAAAPSGAGCGGLPRPAVGAQTPHMSPLCPHSPAPCPHNPALGYPKSRGAPKGAPPVPHNPPPPPVRMAVREGGGKESASQITARTKCPFLSRLDGYSIFSSNACLLKW